MPEAPVINNAEVGSTDDGNEGPTSEGSSIEPGDKPGATRSYTRHRARTGSLPNRSGTEGAMLLSQLRRR